MIGVYTGHRLCVTVVILTKDMWSVLCFRMWMVGYNIAIGLYVMDMWSVMCVLCGYWDLIVIGVYIPGMGSVLLVPYVGVGI